jgi:hypothetical protein
VEIYAFDLFADYFQFYLEDEGAVGDLSDAWIPEAMVRRMAVAPGPVSVLRATWSCQWWSRLIGANRPEPPDEWDHVAEAGMVVRSGTMVIAGCTDYFPDAARIPLDPGEYRVRLYAHGLRSVSPDGLEGADRYRIVLWPGDAAEAPPVLKDFVT